MDGFELTTGSLHYRVIRFILDEGFAPGLRELADQFGSSEDEVEAALMVLQEEHGVVLHPKSSDIWVIHPFSLAPTNFLVRSARGEWWGNCAWCSLVIAALLDEDVRITTTLGAAGKQVEVHIRDGQVVEQDYRVHFPIPMRRAWDNVIYTCSVMLLFESEAEIDAWSQQHGIARGDAQPIQKVWEFSKAWYGQHLNPEWKKWTGSEARGIFKRFGFRGDTWEIPTSEGRF